MANIELVKKYIQNQVNEKGFDENGDLKIDHAGLFEYKDIILAASELGYSAYPSFSPNDGEGISYICENKSDWKVFDCAEFTTDSGKQIICAILVNDETKQAKDAILIDDFWEDDFSCPVIGVDSFEMAEALDYIGAREAGYKFPDDQ